MNSFSFLWGSTNTRNQVGSISVQQIIILHVFCGLLVPSPLSTKASTYELWLTEHIWNTIVIQADTWLLPPKQKRGFLVHPTGGRAKNPSWASSLPKPLSPSAFLTSMPCLRNSLNIL